MHIVFHSFPCFPETLDHFSSDKSEKLWCFLVLPFGRWLHPLGLRWEWFAALQASCANQSGLPFSSICYCLLPLPFCSKSFPDRMLKKLHLRNSRSAKSRSCSEQLKTMRHHAVGTGMVKNLRANVQESRLRMVEMVCNCIHGYFGNIWKPLETMRLHSQ